MNHITDNATGHTADSPAGHAAGSPIRNTADASMVLTPTATAACTTGKGMAPTENSNRNHTLTVHHIGYLVKKTETAITAFQRLGYTVRQDTILDPIRGIHICFMEKDGYVIELVSPANSNSLVSGLLKKYKNCPYHICYETKDLDCELARLTADGYTAIDSPTPAPALDNRRVVFLMSPFLGMIELLET